jgi:methyl-accepting chemotaxis protein
MRLTSKILVMSLLPLVIGGSAILIAGFAFHKQALLHESEERAQMQLERHTEAIRGFFDKAVTSLTVLSASRVLQEGRLPEILEQLRQWEPKLCDIEGLYYSEIDGIVHEPSGKTFSVADRDYFPAIRRGETVLTEALVSRVTGEPVVVIAVPIPGAGEQPIGALGGRLKSPA